MKSCQNPSQASDRFSGNQEGSKSERLLPLFFALPLDTPGNAPDTNTDVEYFLGDLHL